MQPSRYCGDRDKEVEDAAVSSGMAWTSLRASAFAANALGAWADQIRAGDRVRGPYASFAEAPIHERDLAEVAARALHPTDHGSNGLSADALVGQRLVLTGPQSLTHAQMVAVIGEVLGRPLRYEEIPPDAAAQGMVGLGYDTGFVDAVMARYARGAGLAATCTAEVERILGRPARTFAQWVADHATWFRR